jgi:DNA-directed RNA polymerase specialized sigma24 family protein
MAVVTTSPASGAEILPSSPHHPTGGLLPPPPSSDDEAAYALFRRAIVGRDGDAWAALVELYRGLVRGWIAQCATPTQMGEADDLVLRAFERLWRAVPPARFATFSCLGSLLRYLKHCALSTVLDDHRRKHAWERRRADAGELVAMAAPPEEGDGLAGLDAAALWDVVDGALPDPAERVAVYLSYALGLPPREIARRAPAVFADVEAVYKAKRRGLGRLRGDRQVRALWSPREGAEG